MPYWVTQQKEQRPVQQTKGPDQKGLHQCKHLGEKWGGEALLLLRRKAAPPTLVGTQEGGKMLEGHHATDYGAVGSTQARPRFLLFSLLLLFPRPSSPSSPPVYTYKCCEVRFWPNLGCLMVTFWPRLPPNCFWRFSFFLLTPEGPHGFLIFWLKRQILNS